MSDLLPKAPTRAPRALVVIAAVVVVGVAGVGAAQLGSGLSRQTFTQPSVVSPQADRLTVRAGSGDVTVSPSPDGEVHVVAVATYGWDRPALVEESTSEGVLLESRCASGWFGSCSVDYDVKVPPSFAVDVQNTSGEVGVRSIEGPVNVDVSTGDVTLRDLAGGLTVRSSSGGVDAAGLRSPVVRAETSSGDVRAEQLGSGQELVATTNSGEIDLAVTGGTSYRVQVDSGSGEDRVAVPVDPSSSRSIRATTGSGDVTVRPLP